MDLSQPIELTMKRQSLLASCQTVTRFIEPRCLAKQVKLDLALPDESLAPEVWFDESQFQRCLLDLCLNSLSELKPGGRLALAVEPEGFWLRVVVEDNGAGVPPDMKTKVFQPFVTTKAKSSGLGLFNVQRICHAMGVEIQIEDAKPQGARFVLSFPVSQDKPSPLLGSELGREAGQGGVT
jgi:signal transduction histidine kinase